jgi:hypothetical protein
MLDEYIDYPAIRPILFVFDGNQSCIVACLKSGLASENTFAAFANNGATQLGSFL